MKPRAAARLDHENIARVHFVGEDKGVQFIAFEFVRGTNVRDFILQKGTLAPVEAVNYSLQVAQALRHTQAAGVVHRDIKPSNIIITPSGRAKLVDLGLARQEQTDRSHDLTVDGTTLGTFDYIAPEQAVDPRKVDVRADIYSLGCTLYHMLTGEPPFPAGTVFQKVVDHHRDAPPDPAQRNSQVSPPLSRIVQRMMASNPDERHSGPDQLIQDLTQVALALGLRPTHTDDVVWVAPLYESRSQFWDQNRGWLLTLAALLVIALGVQQVPWESLADADNLAPDPVRSGQSTETERSLAAAGENDLNEFSGDAAAAPDVPFSVRRNDSAGLDRGARERASFWEAGEANLDVAVLRLGSMQRQSRSDTPIDLDEPVRSMVSDAELQRQFRQYTTPLPGRDPLIENDTIIRPAAGDDLETAFVVIDPATGNEESYGTLEAACRQAPDEATIELRFDGPLPTPQSPIQIQDKRLVIRAAEGKRPVVEFQAGVFNERSDVTRMISIERGALQIYDVSLLVPVQTAVTERWAVFSLAGARDLQMRGVEVTVRNPQALAAAVVELIPSRSRNSPPFMPESMMHRQTVIDWEDCVVCGGCDVFVDETLDSVDVRLENVALAARGTFASVAGRETFDGPAGEEDRVSFQLRHATVVVTDGMLAVDTELIREFLPVEFLCEDSAIVVRPGRPLIAMAGHQDADVFQRRLAWLTAKSYYDVDGPAWGIDRQLTGDRLEFRFGRFGGRRRSGLSAGAAEPGAVVEYRGFRRLDERRLPVARGECSTGRRWPACRRALDRTRPKIGLREARSR